MREWLEGEREGVNQVKNCGGMEWVGLVDRGRQIIGLRSPKLIRRTFYLC